MKKYMNMPYVKIVRFENKNVIVTSGVSTLNADYYENEQTLVQGRNSLWD